MAGDTTPRRIADGGHPKFSPDGHAIAFSASIGGQSEVFVGSYPNDDGRVQLSADGGTDPVWAPDGHRVFYLSHGRVMVAGLSPRPKLALVSRDSLPVGFLSSRLSSASYDVAQDGKEFVTVEPEKGHTRLVIALHWGTQLAARLGTGSTAHR